MTPWNRDATDQDFLPEREPVPPVEVRQMPAPAYASVAQALVDCIEALVSEHPEILTLESPWDLFRIPGFMCGDLGPSLAQAGWALATVQKKHRQPPSIDLGPVGALPEVDARLVRRLQ